MGGLSPSAVVVISIACAAAVLAMAAAMWKFHSSQGSKRGDMEGGTNPMLVSASNEQQHYMRDVRMRNQLQAWGVAPAYESSYEPPRSHVGRPGSRGGDTSTSFGFT